MTVNEESLVAMRKINEEITKFVKDIVTSVGVNPDTTYCKCDCENACYNIVLCNSTTGKLVGKSWNLIDFLDLCYRKKIEFELNMSVREMITKLDDKVIRNVNKEVITTWI